MNWKIVATAVGFAGWGAAVGWAITTDSYEKKLELKRATNSTLREMLYEANTENDDLRALLTTPKPFEDGTVEIHSPEPLTPADVGTSRTINKAKIHDVSLDAEPNAFDESIAVIEPEIAPKEDTSETDVTGDTEEAPEETVEETRTNLQALIDKYAASPEDRDEFIESAVAHQGSMTDPPFVIPRESFAWDEEGEHYEKTTVTYYPASRVVLDEDDEVIDDPGVTLGWRNLSRFGEESGDLDTVFVRNRRIMTDFEVVRDEDSPLPLHVKYGLGREEFNVATAAGTLRLREEDT